MAEEKQQIRVGSKVKFDLPHSPEMIVNEIEEMSNGNKLKCYYWDATERIFKKVEVMRSAVMLISS